MRQSPADGLIAAALAAAAGRGGFTGSGRIVDTW
jgi:hypothetical protein